MAFDIELQKKVSVVLIKLHIDHPVLLGTGGEGVIYEYGDQALKVYPRISDIDYLQHIQSFQRDLAKHRFTFDTPQISEIGSIDGIFYTLEKRLHGIQMDKKIVGLHTADRQRLYQNYYNAIRQIHAVGYSTLPYGQIINTPDSITADTWIGFLTRKLE